MAAYIIATRPWSFTAAALPILLTAAVTSTPMWSLEVLQALGIGIFVQAGANLTNTYYDFVNGVDTKDNPADSIIVDGKVSKSAVHFLSYLCYAVGVFLASPVLIKTDFTDRIMLIFTIGYFYTRRHHHLPMLRPSSHALHVMFLTGGSIEIFTCIVCPSACTRGYSPRQQCSRHMKADKKRASNHTLAILVGKDMAT